jgi:hypothetical protein
MNPRNWARQWYLGSLLATSADRMVAEAQRFFNEWTVGMIDDVSLSEVFHLATSTDKMAAEALWKFVWTVGVLGMSPV